MTASDLIREARSRAGLTQADLALRLGTTQSAIARWESGSVSPRVDTLQRILAVCGARLAAHLEWGDEEDRRQIRERLAWPPQQRLDYLVSMLAFEETARGAQRLGTTRVAKD